MGLTGEQSTACHICGDEAVGRCYACGALFCAAHGDVNCTRCETGIVEGDFRADRITTAPRTSTARPAWWRPQRAEDFEPSACYICKGLARRVCRNCHEVYCPDHAGAAELCESCTRSSLLGLFILGGILLILTVIVVLGLRS
jgi:hypothetical protein